MKRIKHLLLFVGAALFLAACGTGGNGGDNGGGQDGTLRFALNGVPSAAVEVLSGSDTVFDETVENGDSTTLAAGSSAARAGAVSGYNAPAAQNVTVVAGQTVTATLNYIAQGSDNGDNGDNGTDPVTEAGVHVRVFPPEARSGATVSVLDVDGEVVESESGKGDVHFELDAAQDLRVQVSSPGYSTWTSEYFDLAEDETEDFRVTLAEDNSVSGNIARDGITFDFGDVDGNRYATWAEVNPSKNATLLAAQTEEQICVTVNVVDEAGEPVANAPVSVGLANDFWDAAVAYPGGCENELSAATSSGLGQLYTDSDGNVTFSLQALNAGLAWQMILSGEREPVKVLVSAVGADNVARTAEFKLFALNISHLMFGAAQGDDGTAFGLAVDQLSLPNGSANPARIADTRMGYDFGPINPVIWDIGDSNSVTFVTGVTRKQPTTSPFLIPNFPGDAAVLVPGSVIYAIDEAALEFVEWDGDCIVSTDGTLCVIEDGLVDAAVLSPVSSVLSDGSFSVEVTATYVFDVEYGDEIYPFPLKDYTFTVDWVRGFLDIDKHVSQHVLTWHGEDITLPARTGIEGLTSMPAEYTSTVTVTVSNPSDSTFYNVTVRDGIPAELGVVFDSISDGGTYDPSNHTITWDNVEDGTFTLEAGEVREFTFDVYARQKPGYCWDVDAQPNGGNYTAPRNVEPTMVGECYYDDPYRVTNGSYPESVSVAGFLEDNRGGAEYTFYYTPTADESDIWVVRPFFNLTKTGDSDVIRRGGSVEFTLAVTHVDRVANNSEYARLATEYPWEFNSDVAGTGHRDGGVLRNNPYAHSIDVYDAFDVGLDFTRGFDFDGTLIVPTDTRVVGKDISFNTIPSLPRGGTTTATVVLNGNLLSDDGSVVAQNNAQVQIDGDPAYWAWQNCAYLSAPQLNQPSVDAAFYDELVYGSEDYDRDLPLPATLLADEDARALVADATAGSDDFLRQFENAGGMLEACDEVAVIPAPPTPSMTLTNNGEFNVEPDSGVLNPVNQFDGYLRNENFWYVVTAQNSGMADATNVDISHTLSNANVRFHGTAELYIDTLANIQSGTLTPDATVTVTNSGLVEFGPVVVPAGEYIRIVLPARANQVGTVDMVSTLTYDGGDPLEVKEETTVEPGEPTP